MKKNILTPIADLIPTPKGRFKTVKFLSLKILTQDSLPRVRYFRGLSVFFFIFKKHKTK